jgi:hypothetical protein
VEFDANTRELNPQGVGGTGSFLVQMYKYSFTHELERAFVSLLSCWVNPRFEKIKYSDLLCTINRTANVAKKITRTD